MKHEFPSIRIPKGAKILSARFILADENCQVIEDFSVTKEIQEVIERSEWKSGGRLRLIIENDDLHISGNCNCKNCHFWNSPGYPPRFCLERFKTTDGEYYCSSYRIKATKE